MKILAILLIINATLLPVARAEDISASDAATNAVVISSDLINRLVAEARTNHPTLKAAQSRARAATLNAESIRTWDDPTALFGGSVYSDKGMKPEEEGNIEYGVEQKLPLWGRPKLTRAVADTE